MLEPALIAQKPLSDELGVIQPSLIQKFVDAVDTCQESSHRSEAIDFDRLGRKLHGRSHEEAVIQEVYRRVFEHKRSSAVVVISGADGAGKRALAQTLKQKVEQDGGFYVTGKFDQIQTAEPYAAFVSAFTEFSRIVVSRGDQSIRTIRDAIKDKVAAESQVLVDMIAALQPIIGYGRQGNPSSESNQAVMRFASAFRIFVKAVCSLGKPLVLALANLHLADQSSLDLFSSLLSETEEHRMLFIVTRRDEVEPTCPVSQLLRRLQDVNVSITFVAATDLPNSAVHSIVSEILGVPEKECKVLADFVHHQTNGNALFVAEFLRSLQCKQLLRFERRWVWNDEEISREMEGCNVDDLIMFRVKQQSPHLLEVLKVAGGLGYKLDEALLSCALSASVSRYLAMGVKQGLFLYDNQGNEYTFLHDGVQKAAYSLIAEQDRAFFHVSLGRKLRKNLDAKVFDANIYKVLHQFRLGVDKITSQQERYSVAELCLRAAQRAVAASSFHTASLYLKFGIQLLGVNHWRDEYQLSLALFNTGAEVECCTADFSLVKTLLASVLENGRSLQDKIGAHTTMVYMLGATGEMDQAIDWGLDVLRQLGEPLPSKLVIPRLYYEIAKMDRLTRLKTNEALLRLPIMRKQDKLDAMKILNVMSLSALLVRPFVGAFLSMRMVRLTLKYGLSAISSAGFSLYGMLLCSNNRVDQGYRFGQLSLRLLDKFKSQEWLPRTYCAVYGCINPWKTPFYETLPYLKESVAIGMSSGDIEFAMLNANIYCFVAVDAGVTLPVIESELRRFSEMMTLQKQETALRMLRPFVSLVHALMGLSTDFVSSEGKILFSISDEEAGPRDEQGFSLMDEYELNYFKAYLSYLHGEYELASRLISKIRFMSRNPMVNYEKCLLNYFDALIALALARQGKDRRKNLSLARACLKKLKRWALDAPHNCLSKVSFIQAEEAALNGNSKRAFAKYVITIALAQEERLLSEECLACERAGRYLHRIDDNVQAVQYVQRAHSLYLKWGAKTKARQLRNDFPEYID